MTTTVIEEFILPTLFRYRDRYQWSFNLAKRLINMYYGTDYTEKELKRMYKQNKQKIPPQC